MCEAFALPAPKIWSKIIVGDASARAGATAARALVAMPSEKADAEPNRARIRSFMERLGEVCGG